MLTEKIGPLRAHVTRGSDGNGAGPGATVVLLHGFGAPGTDLVGLAKNLRAPPHTRFVFPEAPEVADVGMPPPYEGRAWWHIDMLNLQRAVLGQHWEALAAHVPEGLLEARAKLNDFLSALDTRIGVGDAPLVLGGFSQGAMLSTDVVLHSERRFDGLLLFSGSFIARADWLTRIEARPPVAVLQSHGRQDPVLPFGVAEELHRAFAVHGWPTNWVPFDGGHGIGAEALRAANEFLGRVLT